MSDSDQIGVYEAPDRGGWETYLRFHKAYIHYECACEVSMGSDFNLADTIECKNWINLDQVPADARCEECGEVIAKQAVQKAQKLDNQDSMVED